MMLKRVVPVVMAGLALWQWDAWRRRRELDRQRTTSATKPAAVNTWEGEGGALRGTGSQLGPDPALPTTNH